jgi:hypothetical protein
MVSAFGVALGLDRPYKKKNFNAIDESSDHWGIKKGGTGRFPNATFFLNDELINNPKNQS